MVERHRIRITRQQALYILDAIQIDLPLFESWKKGGYTLEKHLRPQVVAPLERKIKRSLNQRRERR